MSRAARVGRLDAGRVVGPPVGAFAGLLLLAAAFATAALFASGATPQQLVPVLLVVGVLGFAVTVAEPRWALVGLLFVLVAYLADRAGGELGLPDGSYRYAPVIALAVLLRRALGGRPVRLPAALLTLVALVVATVASMFAAPELEPAVERLVDLLRALFVVALVVVLVDSPTWLRRATWAVALAAAFLAFLTVYQQVTRSYDSDFLGLAGVTSGTYVRSTGPTNPVFFAQGLAAASMLALYLWIGSASRTARFLGLACFGLTLGAIAFTASRGAFLAVGCGLLLALALRPRRAVVPLVGVLVAMAAAVPLLSDEYLQRFASLGAVITEPSRQTVATRPEGSLRGRLGENLAALQMFADHPVLGVGYANYPGRYLEYSPEIGLDRRDEERTPHSLVLEAMAETGVVGTAALLTLLGVALVGSWRARRRFAGRDAILAEGTFVALVALLVAGIFLHIATPRAFFIPVALALAAGAMRPGAGDEAPGPS